MTDEADPFDDLLAQGLELLEEGDDLAAAQAVLERAYALRSDDADVAYALGVIYGHRAIQELGRSTASLLRDDSGLEALLARAIFCYQRAVELDPTHAQPWNNLATLYALRGDRELAIESLKKSLQLAPEQSHVRERLEELGAF